MHACRLLRQHCHGDWGLSNHLCNDPYSPEDRWRAGRVGRGGGAGMKAEPAKAEQEGGGERGKGGKRGEKEGGLGEQQSKAAETQTGKKNRFSFYWQQGKTV